MIIVSLGELEEELGELFSWTMVPTTIPLTSRELKEYVTVVEVSFEKELTQFVLVRQAFSYLIQLCILWSLFVPDIYLKYRVINDVLHESSMCRPLPFTQH